MNAENERKKESFQWLNPNWQYNKSNGSTTMRKMNDMKKKTFEHAYQNQKQSHQKPLHFHGFQLDGSIYFEGATFQVTIIPYFLFHFLVITYNGLDTATSEISKHWPKHFDFFFARLSHSFSFAHRPSLTFWTISHQP